MSLGQFYKAKGYFYMGKIKQVLTLAQKISRGITPKLVKFKKMQKKELLIFFKEGNPLFSTSELKEKIKLTEMTCATGLGLFGIGNFAVREQTGKEDSTKYLNKSLTSTVLGITGLILGGSLGALAGSSLGYFFNENFPFSEKYLNIKS